MSIISQNHNYSEVWERLLFESFRSAYLRNRKVLFAHFPPIFSKSVSASTRCFNLRNGESWIDFRFKYFLSLKVLSHWQLTVTF